MPFPRRVQGPGITGQIGWGFMHQGFASATNLGLSILAGRLLGVGGLGVIFLGFASYLWALGLQKSLISEPYVVARAEGSTETGPARLSSAVTLTLILGLVMSAALAGVGLALDHPLSPGLLYVAPWLAPALLQDLWRTVLFQDGRGAACTLNNAVWLVGMVLVLPLALAAPSVGTVLGVWGLGALAAACLGFVQVRSARPASPREAIGWWRAEAMVFGRQLGAGSLISNSATYLATVLVGSLLGARPLGGLRAVQSILAPLSLIGPALSLPGLPAIMNLADRARAGLARRITLLSAGLTGAYVLGLAALGGLLLGAVFGAEFVAFTGLILPLGLWQVLLAAEVGVVLLLKARRRGRSLLVGWTIGSVVLVAATWWLATGYGVQGAAWALALAGACRLGPMLAAGYLSGRRSGDKGTQGRSR